MRLINVKIIYFYKNDMPGEGVTAVPSNLNNVLNSMQQLSDNVNALVEGDMILHTEPAFFELEEVAKELRAYKPYYMPKTLIVAEEMLKAGRNLKKTSWPYTTNLDFKSLVKEEKKDQLLFEIENGISARAALRKVVALLALVIRLKRLEPNPTPELRAIEEKLKKLQLDFVGMSNEYAKNHKSPAAIIDQVAGITTAIYQKLDDTSDNGVVPKIQAELDKVSKRAEKIVNDNVLKILKSVNPSIENASEMMESIKANVRIIQHTISIFLLSTLVLAVAAFLHHTIKNPEFKTVVPIMMVIVTLLCAFICTVLSREMQPKIKRTLSEANISSLSEEACATV